MSFYDDASLIFDANAAAGKDGKAYSVKPIPEYGSELVTNGGFDTDSDWNKGTGWSISGGTASCDGSTNSVLRQNNAVPLNTKLYVSLEVTNYVSGTLQVKFAPVAYDLNVTKNGIYTLVTDGDNSVNGDIQLVSQGFIGSVDNISIREVISPAGDFTFTRGSNLSATRIGPDGYIEKGRENLLLQSNQFDTTWTNSNSTETSGQSGYDGSSDAWLLDKTGAGGYLVQGIGTSGVQTFSVYAKAGTTDWIELLTLGSGTGSRFVFYDLTNGEIGDEGGSGTYGIDSNIESVGNGWHRCSITFSTTLYDVRVYPAEANSNSATSGNIYIQDAQLEAGLVATDYIETGATTATAGLLEDEPRFDYTGGGCPALLIEGTRTNLIPHSELINASTYYITNSDREEFAGTSPDGSNTATKITSTGYTIFRPYGALTLATNTTYTFSFYAKNIDATGAWFRVYNATNASNLISTTSYFSQLTLGEWVRVQYSFTTTATDTLYYPYLQDGNQGGSILYWGAQLEEGSNATSYIPTYGSSATRATEAIAQLTAPDVNTDAYTFFVHDSHDVETDSNRGCRMKGASNDALMGYYTNASGSDKYFFCYTNDGSGTKAFTNYNAGALTEAKYAYVIDNTSNTAKLFLNGSLVASGTTSVAVEADTIVFGSGAGSPNRIPQIIYFPTALSNNDSEILTGTSYASFASMASTLSYTQYE